MARFTSIGMPRKTFVTSAAEEASPQHGVDDGPSISGAMIPDEADVTKKKRKRARKGAKETGEFDDLAVGPGVTPTGALKRRGWSRDENIAKKARHNAERTNVRRVVRQVTKHSSTTCFACRSIGHAARDCPNVLLAANGGQDAASMLELETVSTTAGGKGKDSGMKRKTGKMGGEVTGGKCYRCNSDGHSLSACQETVDPKNPTPYATCFICLGTGHLSSLCPQNPGRGIYVNGGSCKVCGSVSHRAKDCPDDKRPSTQDDKGAGKGGTKNDLLLGVGQGAGADEDDFMVERRQNTADASAKGPGKGRRGKHEPAKNSFRGPAKPLTFGGVPSGSKPASTENTSILQSITPGEELLPARTGRMTQKAKVVNF